MKMIMRGPSVMSVVLSALFITTIHAFTPSIVTSLHTRMALALSTSSTDEEQTTLSLSLEKPLGMILEEVEEGAPKGVFVLELADGGSAAQSPQKDDIVGSTLATVMGEDVTTIDFDAVMEKIINAPSPVELELIVVSGSSDDNEEEDGFALGTPVTVTVQRDGQPDLDIDTKVGDNLRQLLIDNEVEVYRGFKAKIGNCGGGGQCGFCAVEFVDSQGWEPRSEYEDNKIKNSPNSRLSCLNNIQGPVTIKM
ncbi:Inherit from NOG: Ferredoxin [Seminavis robusta]|uniref:Inherit from NOG: Ferredoxin n=1 Tax=Seminavis robusta TaxID=568900 RepID=A0A9N8HJE5_9STRA|nr:Inherit from NOG: Ferredoxin [Seminavis robusta]|eukprot:Sro688_g187390.1 Inherit from NOG: Ferredoxin (252) ;mRNA; r:31308-32063